MDLFFSYVYRFLHRYLGVRRPLSPQERTLAWMFSLYDFNYALSGVFINIFLFRRDMDLGTVMLFNLTQFGVVAPAFWLGGHLSKRWGNLLSYQLGFLFSAAVFGATLILRESAPDHPCLLGCLAGLGIGFYFLGEHSLTLEMTTEETRDYFLSLTTFFSSVLCILAPAMAGWLIAAFAFGGPGHGSPGSSLGYYIVFSLALAIYLGLTFRSLRFRAQPSGHAFEYWRILTLPGNGDWNRLMAAQFVLGLRNGVFWFLIWLLVFRISHNEGVVGSYNMLCNLLAVLTTYALSLWAKAGNRWMGLWVSSCLMGLACVGLYARFDAFSILAFAVLNATGNTWFQVAFGSLSFRLLERSREAGQRRLEYLALRELPLALGRISGVVGLWICLKGFGEGGLHTALLGLGSAHLGIFLFLPRDNSGNEAAAPGI
jgi:YQGE family putative transporter